MESLAVFLVKNIVGAGVLFCFYLVALRGRKFHRYNRFYLLGILLLSLVLPLINLRLYSFSFLLPNETSSFSNSGITGDMPVSAFSVRQLILFVCSAISVFMIVCLLMKIIWVYRMVRMHEVKRMDGYYFIESDLKEAPFTFMDKLFWKKTISLQEDAGRQILSHELVHIREKHTCDKLFSQLLLCFFWINPFYWFIQRELNIVHEFLADAKSIKEDDVTSFAKMLLRSHNDGRYLDPVHPFFNSSVKRRLDMITRPGKSNNFVGRISVLPVIGFIIALFSFSPADREVSGKISHTQPAVQNIVLRDNIPVNTTAVEKKQRKTISAKRSSKKETQGQFIKDKMAGIEKRAELQKPATMKKGNGGTSERKFKDDFEYSVTSKKNSGKPSPTKESLKPVNNKEKKPGLTKKPKPWSAR